jgi:hypothetical protein
MPCLEHVPRAAARLMDGSFLLVLAVLVLLPAAAVVALLGALLSGMLVPR